MSTQVLVTNTLAFLFPPGAAQPSLEEMARFVKTLAANPSDMEAAYKISEERRVFVKFRSEAAMKIAIKRNPMMHNFHYSNGKVVEVCMMIAGNNVRYVRVFDLPPEISDLEVSLVLENYGKVKRVEREKFPADLGLGDLCTGVRGVHLDVQKDIPPILRFLGRKGRVYYEEMKMKCYVCLSEGHLKAACPNKKVNRNTNGDTLNSNSSTFASQAGGSASSIESEEMDVLEQGKKEGKITVNEISNEEKGNQPNKPQQQQKQTMPPSQQKTLKSGSPPSQLHSKVVKQQQKSQRSTTEASPSGSPPRKNHRSDSPTSDKSSN